MPKPSRSKAGRLTAEEKLLEQQHAELLRKQQELTSRLERLPAVVAEQQAQKRKLRAEAAGPAISPYGSRTGGKRGRSRGRTKKVTPFRERWVTQFKTFGWLIVLAVIIFMVLKAIPTH